MALLQLYKGNLQMSVISLHQAPPKNCYVALSRPTVKCEKTGFFFFFFLCQIWAKNLLKFVFNGLKKHLYICVLTAFRPSFPHLETFKKILENSTLSRYVKKKKNRPTDPIFRFWSGEGNITIFFWASRTDISKFPTLKACIKEVNQM